MLYLQPIIDRINALLADGTAASTNYAALEARLALEKVCYDRLRQSHDYISHAQLQKWSPSAIVNTLMQEVNPLITKTMILRIAKHSAIEGAANEYLEIGTEEGLDSKLISKLWNALSKLALHVRLPNNKLDSILDFGDTAKIRKKVEEVVAELERLARGTMITSGVGMEVSFDCQCGENNKRRAGLLKNGQQIQCINPECKFTWKAVKSEKGFDFETVSIPVDCENCKVAHQIPPRLLFNIKYDEQWSFSCYFCRHKNYVQWQLISVQPEPASS